MGWNTSALFIKRPERQVIEAVAGMFEPTDQTVDWDVATSWIALDPNLAIAAAGEWTIAWCPSWECVVGPAYEALRCALSRGGAVLAMIWSSVASSYGYRYYVDGELVREIMYENGKPDTEHGDPLPAEANIELPSWGPDEDWAWKIIERLGPTVDMDAPWQLLRHVSSVPSGWTGDAPHVAKKSPKPPAKKPVVKPAKKAAKPAKKAAKPAKKSPKPVAKPAKKSPKPAAKPAKKPKPAKKRKR